MTNALSLLPVYRYVLVRQNYLSGEAVKICLFDYETLSDLTLNVEEIFNSDDILIQLSAIDLRSIMSIWADHCIQLEYEQVKYMSH